MNISKTFFLVTLLLSVQSFSDEVGFFTFTPKGGAELLHPNGDPTTVIKIYFDSEIVYVTDEGEHLDLTRENLLKMIEIKQHDDDGVDLVNVSGPIDASKVSFSNAEGKTTITINPPDTKAYYSGNELLGYSTGIELHNVTAKNFALKNEVESMISDDNLPIHSVTYPNFFVTYLQDSCSSSQPHLQVQLTSNIENSIHSSFRKHGVDPNTTYNIDITFIISENNLNYRGLEYWKQFLDEGVLPTVNKIYQNSGVNVQFNAKAVKAFLEYTDYLNCPRDLDDIPRGFALNVIRELVPRIQNDTGADLIYALHDYRFDKTKGVASLRGRYVGPHFASRWYSVGSLNTAFHRYMLAAFSSSDFFTNEVFSSVERDIKNSFAITLAHELGHNLGLEHMVYPNSSDNFTGYGYGYYDSFGLYGTIMSSGNRASMRGTIPLFSSNEIRSRSDICGDNGTEQWLHTDFCNNILDGNDVLIRLGDSTANSRDALQYTIEDASNYSELYRVNKRQ